MTAVDGVGAIRKMYELWTHPLNLLVEVEKPPASPSEDLAVPDSFDGSALGITSVDQGLHGGHWHFVA